MKHQKIIILLVITSFFLFIGGCANSNETMQPSSSAKVISEGEKLVIKASSFKFEPSEVKIPANKDIELQLDMGESLHGLAIPELNVDIKEDGESVMINAQPGEYTYVCSIMCGAGHEDMKGVLIVE